MQLWSVFLAAVSAPRHVTLRPFDVAGRRLFSARHSSRERVAGMPHSSAPQALWLAVCVLGALFFAASVRVIATESGEAPDPKTTTYYGDVEPIVKERCIGCHAGDRPKARLNLESLEAFLEGGRKGPALVPGKPDESLVYLLIAGEKKPIMPPKKEGPLSAEQIAVFKAWIVGGCAPGEKKVEVAPYSQPIAVPMYSRAPAVTAMTYGPEGKKLYVAGYHEILVHDMADVAEASDDTKVDKSTPSARFLGEAESLYNLQISPDGRFLAAVGGSPARFGELQVWELASGQLHRWSRHGSDCLYALSFSPDGKRLVVGGTDRALHVLDFESGKELFASEIHSDWVFGATFSADGSRLASAGRDKTVKVSAAEDGKFLKNLATLGGPVMRVVARPGSQQFVIASDSKQAILYDAKELKEIRKLEDQSGPVLAAAFSQDGKQVAVGGASKEVRVYDADHGKRQWTLTGPADWVYAIAFRPDGKQLAASGYDGIVHLFDLESGKAIRSFSSVPVGRFRRF